MPATYVKQIVRKYRGLSVFIIKAGENGIKTEAMC